MRLSDIKGERLLWVIGEIAEPIANIALDDEVAAYFKGEKCPEGVDPRQFTIRKLTKAIPAVIGVHRADIITVLAALDGVPREEYAENLDPVTLLNSIKEKLTDEELLNFLSQFVAEAKTQSGAA